MMRIGILETGRPSPALCAEYGDYSSMVAKLLSSDGSLLFQNYWLQGGAFPGSIGECDGWIITGSRCSVLDEEPWMLKLEALIREARQTHHRFVGICFGHQIIAKALGGEVRRAPTGFRVGLNCYRLTTPPHWLDETGDTLRINAIHQDQVVAPPPEAKNFAIGEDCPLAALEYDDWAISFQAHPEFSISFAKALLSSLDGVTLPGQVAKPAIAALSEPAAQTDSASIGVGIARFLRTGAGVQ